MTGLLLKTRTADDFAILQVNVTELTAGGEGREGAIFV
jgi:hypothetical protein